MSIISLTPEILRALGEGVSRLRDGDLKDCLAADEIVEVMAWKGYVLTGQRFVLKDWLLVVSHLHYDGADRDVLTAGERKLAVRQADGFGPGVTDPELLGDWSHVRDSSDAAVRRMAAEIRRLRQAKGLPVDPANLG